MAALLLLNDSALRVFEEDQLRYDEPGYVTLNGERLVFGQAALAQYRLQPQQANNQFLERLSTEPLPRPLGPARHHADLIYHQFVSLSAQLHGPVVMATPAGLQPDQLGLLLGIAREAGLEVSGFVDRAVLGALALDLPERCWHLDLHLHRAALTELILEADGATLARGTSDDLAGCGLGSLLEGLINVIADQFVQQSRFDPLHAAATEQQLYDQVFQWVRSGSEQPTVQYRVHQQPDDRLVSLDFKVLKEKLRTRLAPLLDRLPQEATLVLSDTSARVPGLAALLQERVNQVLVEPEQCAAGHFAAGRISATDGERVTLKARLPYRGAPRQSASDTTVRPTHALFRGIAEPLERLPGLEVRSHDGIPTITQAPPDLEHNGTRRPPPIALAVGDELRFDNRRCELIQVRG